MSSRPRFTRDEGEQLGILHRDLTRALRIAQRDVTSHRRHVLTWAWGAVVSTGMLPDVTSQRRDVLPDRHVPLEHTWAWGAVVSAGMLPDGHAPLEHSPVERNDGAWAALGRGAVVSTCMLPDGAWAALGRGAARPPARTLGLVGRPSTLAAELRELRIAQRRDLGPELARDPQLLSGVARPTKRGSAHAHYGAHARGGGGSAA